MNLTFSNFLKLLFESRKKVQVISYFYLNSFPIQIASIRNVRRFRGIQSWSWIIQIYIKNAELLEQPVHFIENIGRTLGNENKYHPFLSFLLKGHAGKKTDFLSPIINHKVSWNQDSDLVSKKGSQIKPQWQAELLAFPLLSFYIHFYVP